MKTSLEIYHRMPPWMRTVAASMRGYYLSRWRYDKNSESLVEKILERDYWSEKEWREWEEERLTYILNRAATKVPYYREKWAERRKNGDNASWQYLENWDVLEKQTLRSEKFRLVAEDCNRSKMFHDNTSGTTGKSVDIWLDRNTVKLAYALFEARVRRWHGVSRHDRWAILGGQLVAPFNQQNPPFWVWNAGLKQLYMSAYHIKPGQTRHYLDALVKYRVEYVLGYSAAIYHLAQEALKLNYKGVKLKVAITNAEPLYDYQRAAIEAAFDCPVRETYGMAELAATATECEQGKLHIWRDGGIIELGETDETGAGDLICTGLINADMPLIKYRVGDYGKLSVEKCSCGRNLPVLAGIDGRTDDVLYTKDGRLCSHLHLVMGGNLPISEAQIVQDSLEKLRVLYVPAKDFVPDSLETLKNKIFSRMGEIAIDFQEVNEIPRTAKGKFRAVVCNLPKQ